MTAKTDFLAKAPLFSGLRQARLEAIAARIFEKNFARGEMVLTEGSPVEALYVVAEGVVKTFKTSSDGKEQIIALMRPGDSFDDVPLLDHEPAPLSAQALGPVKLYGLRRADMELLLKQHPELAHSMLRLRAKRIRELIAVVEDLSFRSVAGRVARILLENAGSPSQLGPRLTQRDMAAMAGTAREVVGRSLKYLEEEGLVRMEDHRLVITDKAKLERMVEPGS